MKELARKRGRFGHIRILERKSDGARLYCIDSSVQTMIQPDGVSMFGYVHAAKLLLMPAHKILIIGGAGGSLATMLARTGRAVTVLDIDPAAEALARDYFGLDPSVRWVTGDLSSFYGTHDEVFDAQNVNRYFELVKEGSRSVYDGNETLGFLNTAMLLTSSWEMVIS